MNKEEKEEELMNQIKAYVFGNATNLIKTHKQEILFLNKFNKFMNINKTNNTGKLSELYVKHLLEQNNIKYKEQPIIRYGSEKNYIKPDFYIKEKDLFIEVKSRSYYISGTASEKIDHIPRKYHKLKQTSDYKNSKILIVFSAGELHQDSTLELLNNSNEYVKDFKVLSKKHNILEWISIDKLNNFI